MIPLPLDEAAADRVVLQLVEDVAPSHQLARHRVRVRKIPLGLVVDDVLQREVEGVVPQLHGKALIRMGHEAVQEFGLDGCRLLADHARQRCSLGAVPDAGCAQAAVEMDLEPGGLRELIGRQSGAALIEVIGDAHRTNRVGARRARSHLVELVHDGHHGTLGLLHDVEVRRQGWSR